MLKSGKELRERGVVRNKQPDGRCPAEYLFFTRAAVRLAASTELRRAGYDATGNDGVPVSVKTAGHRHGHASGNPRHKHGGHFDVLAGVLFDDDFYVMTALIQCAC